MQKSLLAVIAVILVVIINSPAQTLSEKQEYMRKMADEK